MSAIIIGPATVAALAAALALVIAILDRLLNNYGTLRIGINGGKKELSVRGGSALLGTLAGEGIFVPSACGGRGSCGACKCRVLTDIGPHLPTETPYLSPEEMSRNVRLACQVKVRRELELELPESLFRVKRFQSTVERIRDLTYDIKEVTFSLGGQAIEFDPGQYVQIVVPPYDQVKESTQRAYSMSSVPSDSGHVELLIRLVPGGIATTWVHKHLKLGDPVDLIGPFGEFHVHDTPATMLCVAGGSGMAPFKSMLWHMKESGAYPEKEIWYFFGARTTKDMFYLDELRALAASWPRFHFVAALSEPAPGEAWAGDTGLITDVLDRYVAGRIDRSKGFEGYLCGSPGMINACIAVMRKNGVKEEDIFFDKFA
jgi:Na+-transporting NADH:ubiquinone oxidoreductase subunit F